MLDSKYVANFNRMWINDLTVLSMSVTGVLFVSVVVDLGYSNISGVLVSSTYFHLKVVEEGSKWSADSAYPVLVLLE